MLHFQRPNNLAIIFARRSDSDGLADFRSSSVFLPTPRRRRSRFTRLSGRTARRTRFFCLPNDTAISNALNVVVSSLYHHHNGENANGNRRVRTDRQ
jgi:hypothetical protein